MSNKELTKVVAACILGDGGVYIPKDGSINAHFILSQTTDHQDHIDYIKNYLETLTSTRLAKQIPKMPKGATSVKEIGRLYSMRHPFYTQFRANCYPNGVKVVHPHYLTLIDWEFLAIWFMQDGCNNRLKNTNYLIRNAMHLCTLNFSYGDNMLLRRALAEKLNLHWSVVSHRQNGKQYWKLALSHKCTEEFVDGISKYVQPSFYYKLELERRTPIT